MKAKTEVGPEIAFERINATEAKNRFGEVLEKVANNVVVSLMRRGEVSAYVVTPSLFSAIQSIIARPPSELDALDKRFEEMLESMQRPEALTGMKSLMRIDTAALTAIVREEPPAPRSRARKASR